jgi:hypothetical protein
MGLDTKDDRTIEPVPGTAVSDWTDDPFAPWRALQLAEVTDSSVTGPSTDLLFGAPPALADSLLEVDPIGSLAVLDDPRLVISEGYVGVDRRRRCARARLLRITHGSRRRLLRLEVLFVAAIVVIVAGTVFMVAGGSRPSRASAATATRAVSADGLLRSHPHAPAAVPPVAATAPADAPAIAPTAATIPPATVPTTVPTAVPTTSLDTPNAMGAAALALVRYPWQQIAGYSIQFLPISDAPSPGYYGNTTFTWGRVGGTSTLYVYPGETVQRLAGITAFEIGHEVDAGYVEPQGGHQAIADILGVHPASWAPECDCAEQGYLSGWYAAAFSNYWSPGVGQWSTLAPEPSGATLTAMEPWLDPRIS